jgi:hypothetical protein
MFRLGVTGLGTVLLAGTAMLDDAGIKAAVAAWRPMKSVYAEMVAPVGKAKLSPAIMPGLL